MRLVRAKLYLYDTEVSAEDQKAINEAAFDMFNEERDRPVFLENKFENWHHELIWDIDILPIHLISKLCDIKPLHLPQKLAEVFTPRANTVYNEHVKVVMPGLGLLQFDHVEVQYDTCTDELRKWLGRGWRIIAVCPQPDQRRPDYVLGRVGAEE